MMLMDSDRAEIDRLLVQWEKASSGGLNVGGMASPMAGLEARGTRAATLDVIFHDEVARTTHALEAMHRYLANVLINSRFEGKRGYQDKGQKVSRMTLWRRRQAAERELHKAEEEFLRQYRSLKYGHSATQNRNQSYPQL